jgi:hypothetical protein
LAVLGDAPEHDGPRPRSVRPVHHANPILKRRLAVGHVAFGAGRDAVEVEHHAATNHVVQPARDLGAARGVAPIEPQQPRRTREIALLGELEKLAHRGPR